MTLGNYLQCNRRTKPDQKASVTAAIMYFASVAKESMEMLSEVRQPNMFSGVVSIITKSGWPAAFDSKLCTVCYGGEFGFIT